MNLKYIFILIIHSYLPKDVPVSKTEYPLWTKEFPLMKFFQISFNNFELIKEQNAVKESDSFWFDDTKWSSYFRNKGSDLGWYLTLENSREL